MIFKNVGECPSRKLWTEKQKVWKRNEKNPKVTLTYVGVKLTCATAMIITLASTEQPHQASFSSRATVPVSRRPGNVVVFHMEVFEVHAVTEKRQEKEK